MTVQKEGLYISWESIIRHCESLEIMLKNIVVEEEINLSTKDGVKISGSYTPSPSPNNTIVLLLHQLRKDRTIWNVLVQKLISRGYSCVTIDFRGHGKSGGGSWEDFTDEQFQGMIHDVEAAGEYIRKRFPTANIALIGSSIGANLALNYVASTNTSSVVLLSPGLDYKGIKTEEVANNYSKPIFLAASSDDENSSMEAIQRIASLVTTPEVGVKIVTYSDGGHGAHMFSVHPDLLDQIVSWVK